MFVLWLHYQSRLSEFHVYSQTLQRIKSDLWYFSLIAQMVWMLVMEAPDTQAFYGGINEHKSTKVPSGL